MVTHRYPVPVIGTPVLPAVSAYMDVLLVSALSTEYENGVAPLAMVCLYDPAGLANGPPCIITYCGNDPLL